MWFDLVLIDRVFEDGTLKSHHIRPENTDPFPVDSLEDIDPTYRQVDAADLGPLRVYGASKMRTTQLSSKLANFVIENGQMLLQLEHMGIPVVSGYYAIIFPIGWRVRELNIYDPYDNHESVANKRSYRNVDLLWDNNAGLNCAQFNMQSVRRGTFSTGVIATLAQSTMDHGWKDRPASLGIEFSDPRHQGHNLAQGFQSESQAVIAEARAEQTKMPAINIGLSGPSVNIVEWGRFLREKVRGSKR